MAETTIKVVRVGPLGVDVVPPVHPVIEQRIGDSIEYITRYSRLAASLLAGHRVDGIVRVTLESEGVRVILVARNGEITAVAVVGVEDQDRAPEASRANEASEAV